MSEPIRVVLADDQALMRSGLRLILEDEPGLQVVAEAGDGAAAIAAVRTHRPDVVLMDVRMPAMDGLEATRRLLADPGTADVRVVVLTTFELDEYVFEALRLGAAGFLAKTAPPEELVAAVRAAAAGDAVLSPGVTRRVIRELVRLQPPPRAGAPDPAASLTARERAVLGLVARGLSNAEIGRELFVAEATVKTHVSAVLAKLGLRDRVQAVVWAYEHGVVRPGDDPAVESR